LGAKLQNWWKRNIWDLSGNGVDGLPTINGSLLASILGSFNYSGENVTVRKGLQINSVYTCVNVISKTICSLPANVFREEGGKRTSLTDHHAYYPIAHEPNEYMSAANFWITIIIHLLGWGNGYAKINRDSRRNPVSFDIWEPWKVTIVMEGGNLFYHYCGEQVPARDIFHLRLNSLDGILGLSPILENQDTMGMAMALKRYAALGLGAQPPGTLSYEGTLTPTQIAENQKNWKERNKDEVVVLSGKWKYDPIMADAEATQFIQTKAANDREVYGIYQIPPTFAQNFERATYTNAEQSDLVYAKHTITPIITVIEKELNMKLFFEREKANTFVKFNMNGLLRGDLAARQGFYQTMVNGGIMLRNEARALEDMNAYDGGDVPLIQGAMIPGDTEGIDALRKKMETEVIPSATKPVNGKHLNGHAALN
jgi:HK97 family phage portal protein